MFGQINLQFQGKNYSAPHNMRLIQAVRREITSESANEVDICMGFSAALKCAGARVSDEDVYKEYCMSEGTEFAKYIGSVIGDILNPFNEATESVNAKSPAATKKPRKSRKKS